MDSIYLELSKNKEINKSFPTFIDLNNIHFEVITGSTSYGIKNENSDIDLCVITIPPPEDIFPYISGYLFGFDAPKNYFTTFQKHHINHNNKQIDLTVYSITKFFNLCIDNNPNIIDIMFTPEDCIITISKIGEIFRKEKKLFLSKRCYYKFKGYAYSQVSKMEIQKRECKKRQVSIDNFGYDTKFAYHCVRLILELEQILKNYDLDLKLNSQFLTEIRNGKYELKEIKSWFTNKEKEIDLLFQKTNLPESSDKNKIKKLLLTCLEEYFGNISKFYPKKGKR